MWDLQGCGHYGKICSNGDLRMAHIVQLRDRDQQATVVEDAASFFAGICSD